MYYLRDEFALLQLSVLWVRINRPSYFTQFLIGDTTTANMFITGILPELLVFLRNYVLVVVSTLIPTIYIYFYFLKSILKYYIGTYVIIVSEKIRHLKHKLEI